MAMGFTMLITRAILLSICLVIFQMMRCVASLCKFSIKHDTRPENLPFIISDKDESLELYYPEHRDKGTFVFSSEELFNLVCPNTTDKKINRIFVKRKAINESNANVQCFSDGRIEIHGKIVAFSDISCEDRMNMAVIRPSNRSCQNSSSYEIGYNLGHQFGFLKIIDLCHNDTEARTKWAHATIYPETKPTKSFQLPEQKPYVFSSLYNNMNISQKDPYEPKNSHFELRRLFHGRGIPESYVSPNASDGKFLAKGQLIANSDMLSKRAHESTYFYENVVPIWHSINAQKGNWLKVQKQVRRLANKRSSKMDLYAGAIGTLEIEWKEFYLYQSNKIPVPKILFKCLIDHDEESGICFLVANNPYITAKETKDYVICKKMNVCDEYFDYYADVKRGFTYCCGLTDFYRANVAELGDELKPMEDYRKMSPL